jgi:hypothetical protein
LGEKHVCSILDHHRPFFLRRGNKVAPTYHCVSATTTAGQGSAHLSLAERGRIEVARSDHSDDARLLEKLTNQAGEG